MAACQPIEYEYEYRFAEHEHEHDNRCTAAGKSRFSKMVPSSSLARDRWRSGIQVLVLVLVLVLETKPGDRARIRPQSPRC
ncbi:hypothetical protein CA85_31960 [Allorhodopirellula solitaria]|uniref:Uncharacterized protein n=1 Tax=Allorhodopirellula solitaria TaxID=2527987 RepID=A0A5C5XQV4_9BACT|nr:hypothetical protein CA85_31960 [Allorhodopirellula solitaria]